MKNMASNNIPYSLSLIGYFTTVDYILFIRSVVYPHFFAAFVASWTYGALFFSTAIIFVINQLHMVIIQLKENTTDKTKSTSQTKKIKK